jgi:hypothetical protein
MNVAEGTQNNTSKIQKMVVSQKKINICNFLR